MTVPQVGNSDLFFFRSCGGVLASEPYVRGPPNRTNGALLTGPPTEASGSKQGRIPWGLAFCSAMVEDSSPRIRAGKRRSACRFSLWIVLLATHVASTHMAAGKGFSLGKVTTRATTAAPMLAWPAAAPGEVGREWPASLRLRGGRCKRRATAVEVLAAKRHKGSADRKIVTVPVVKGSAIRLRAFPDLSPKIIVFIPLTASASSHAALRLFHDSFTPRANSSDTTLTPDSLRGPVTIALPPHCSGATPGQRVTLLSVAGSDSIAMLDALKVADCAVLVHAGDELPDPTCGEDQVTLLPHATPLLSPHGWLTYRITRMPGSCDPARCSATPGTRLAASKSHRSL